MALLKALQELLRPEIEQMSAARNNTVVPVQAPTMLGRMPSAMQRNPYEMMLDNPGTPMPDMNWTEMQPGGGRFRLPEDSSVWDSGAGSFVPAPKPGPSLSDEEEKRLRMALAFNTLRLEPDQGLAAVLADRVKTIGAEKKAEKSKNKTIVALQNMGMDKGELDLLAENPELLKVAAQAMYKARTGQDTTAEIKTMEWMTQGLPEDQKLLARRMAVGLEPKASSVKFQNLGTSIGVFANGQQVGTLPIDYAGVEREKALGAASGEAQVQYPQIVGRLDDSIGVIDRVLKMPNFDDAFGVLESRMPTLSQETRDVEIAIEQVQKGQFLAAIDQLRGLGALSNAEGAAATAAQTSLNLAMSPAAARKELARLKEIMETGKQRALNKTIVDPDFVPQYIKDYEAQKSGSGSGTVIINGTKITPVE